MGCIGCSIANPVRCDLDRRRIIRLNGGGGPASGHEASGASFGVFMGMRWYSPFKTLGECALRGQEPANNKGRTMVASL